MNSQKAFTIIELLIVIVIIAILAAIIAVVYSGIQDRAEESVVKSDLSQASKVLAADMAITGSYPADTASANEGGGLSASDGMTYQYTTDGSSYCLSATTDDIGYHVENNGSPQEGVCAGHDEPSGGGGGSEVACSSASIGDTGPGGGAIFYKDGATCYEAAPNGWYVATAPNDPEAEWGCYGVAVSGADGVSIGSGEQNTADMLAAGCSSEASESLLAAEIASEYTGGGESDWFLPSRDEFVEMYQQREHTGSFISSEYWTSSENPSFDLVAWLYHVTYESPYNNLSKSATSYVRPVRSFSD